MHTTSPQPGFIETCTCSRVYEPPAAHNPNHTRFGGFTLIEILMVVAILSTLSAIAVPAYNNYREKAEIARAVSEIKILSEEISAYAAGNNTALPITLNDIGRAGLLDPWGNPYKYLNYATVHGAGDGIRKDRNLHPLNSDYDLYSMGKDGQSQAQITTPFSRDDIIRASDGRFIGLAANY
jgi:general secretion pathway protein G